MNGVMRQVGCGKSMSVCAFGGGDGGDGREREGEEIGGSCRGQGR